MHFFTLLTATLLGLALSADPMCQTGLPIGKACCPRACGTCGGPKCGSRSRAANTFCCKGSILRSPRNCLTSDPPCKITTTDENFVAGSTVPDPTCHTGLLTRKACCPAECSVCGGTGCKARGRMIKSNCCVGSIKNKMEGCDTTGPPCVVHEPEMTQIPEQSPEMSPEMTAVPLPDICELKKPVSGCFCYATLNNIISIRKRFKFVVICKARYGRKAINKMAEQCKKYAEGVDAVMHVKMLVDEVNSLIPKCYPSGTPLVKFKP